MAAPQQQFCPAPFDAVAQQYDQTFTFSNVGQMQRRAVWQELGNAFHAGDRVLEIGCGTGVDACFLAERGVRVMACDSSSQMIAVAERRIGEKRLQESVQAIHLAAEHICARQTSDLFDGALSNFGTLNCVEDVGQLASHLGRLLKPGARALLCWIGPCCLWEMIWYLGHGNPKKAFRRLHRDGVIASVNKGSRFRVRYPSVRQIVRSFSGEFRLCTVRGIGVAVPPSYMEAWAQRHPRTLRMCEQADLMLARIPGCRVLADHVLLQFERRDTKRRGA